MSQLQFIDQQRVHYPAQLLCHILAVVPSRYYAWCQRAETPAKPVWETAMVNVFGDHQRRYGTRRLRVALRELGHHALPCGPAHGNASPRPHGLHTPQ